MTPVAQLADSLASPPDTFIRLVELLGPDREKWMPDRSGNVMAAQLPIPCSSRISESTAMQIVEAYKAGASTTDLRREFGLSQGVIVRVLQPHHVETRFKSLTAADIRRAKKLYVSGLSLAKVGHKLHRAPSSVRVALVRSGVVMRRKGGH